MHTIEHIDAGTIDGTVRCDCGWQRMAVYPNSGWGNRSVGIRRIQSTKKQWITDNLVAKYIGHVAHERNSKYASA